MKRTFKEKSLSKAAEISKKHKFLKPFVLVVLGIVLFSYNAVLYFKKNAKRYITMGLSLIFFIMSSSFATPEQSYDNETYLNSEISAAGEEENLSESKVVELSNIELEVPKEDIANDDEIVSVNNLDEATKNDLESTENVDKFTVEDFISESDEGEEEDTGESAFDKNAWNLILVNKTNPVPDDYEVKLATIKDDMKCDERVLTPLTNMLNAAKEDGVDLIVVSPYRDYKLQKVLFERKVNSFLNKGYSYMDAYKAASKKVIVPGASEHQIGMAFDIVTGDHAVLDYAFGDTEAGKWLKEHGAEYGFILRYPRGKEYITGIEYEPWHFRYVGKEAAEYIMENDITLEEFIDGL